MTAPIILAGGEAASFEKLTEALRKAVECADNRNRAGIRRWLLQATEAATELGVYLADGRWAQVCVGLDTMRQRSEQLPHMAILKVAPYLADNLRALLVATQDMRHGRVRH